MTDCDSWFDLSLVNCNCHRILPDFSVLLRVFVIYRLKICATSPLCFLLSNCAPLHYVFYAIPASAMQLCNSSPVVIRCRSRCRYSVRDLVAEVALESSAPWH